MAYQARDYMSVPEAARELHTKPETLRQYARRASDPFPIRLLPWCGRNGIVQRREMDAWFARNASLYGREE